MRILYWGDVAFFVAVGTYIATHRAPSPRFTLGMAMAAAALTLWIAARLQLGSAFSATAQARTLVTTGLYSRIRHPVYVFGLIADVGLIIAWGDWRWLGLLALFIPVEVHRAHNESARLEAAFGEEYRRYRRGPGSDYCGGGLSCTV